MEGGSIVKKCGNMPRLISAMPGKKIRDIVRSKIKELLPGSTRKGLPKALPNYLPNECAAGLRAISLRTIERIAAEAKKAGEPYRRPLRSQSTTIKQRQVQMRRQARKKRLDQALEAFRAGQTYKQAAQDAGISVSALYRHCRAESLREKDRSRLGDQESSNQGK